MKDLKAIGWIGTGVMGNSMCKHLLKHGYSLSVFNRTASKTDELVALGAKYSSIKEIAQNCNLIFTIVGLPSDVREVYFSADGLLSNANENTIIVDHTTSSPDLAEEIFEKAAEKSISVIDAPVSGGDVGAKNGTLIAMCGGEEATYDKVKDIMSSYCANSRFFGDAGKGQHTKMANQVIIASTMVGLVEGMLYAYKAGLNVEQVVDLLKGGAAGSKSMEIYSSRIIKRDFEPGFFVEHFVKDLRIVIEETQKMKIKLKGMELALSFYELMVEQGLGRKGTQGLYLVLEKLVEESYYN